MSILDTTIKIQKTFEEYELCRLQARQVAELAEKLQKKDVTIAVIGQFKRGKTTMVNSILGRKILPVGIVPITAAVTRILYAEPENTEGQAASAAETPNSSSASAAETPNSSPASSAESAGADAAIEDTAKVYYQNGLCETVPSSELHAFISEQENHDNERGVAEVEIRSYSEFLKDGLILVDTPGVGSVHELNSKSAYDFARESDGVIFMLSVDSPINQIEIEFLRSTRKFAGKFYFTVNKIDTIDEEELAEYMDYCNGLICDIMDIEPGSDEAKAIRLIPISAKKNIGIDHLKEVIREDLIHNAAEIMKQSTGLKLLEILQNTRAQIHSYREVLKMAPNVFRRRFEEMHELMQKLRTDCENLPAVNADGSEKKYYRARLNEEKALLTAKVRELFGIEYFYYVDRSDAAEQMSRDEYVAELLSVYDELEETINAIFMYKEENAYTVARRIEDLNILMHVMDKYKREIQRTL